MALDDQPTGNTAEKQKHMKRGRACFNCRRRKMRCDGVLPVCTQCAQANRPDDCQYTFNGQTAPAQVLQENIKRVQGRINELEQRGPSPTPVVKLQQPYQQNQASSEPLGELPMDTVTKLVDAFLSYSSEVGFFLHGARFRHAMLLPQPWGHPGRPAPVLVMAVYLWGLRLAPNVDPQLVTQTPEVLARALEILPTSISGSHPERVMHTLQAEVLLAQYFFSANRFLEGKYHATNAASLTLANGLHIVRSQNKPSVLPPPRDSIEEGERVHAFWSVLNLDKTWSVALDTNAYQNVQDPTCTVDTPWPLEPEEYERGQPNPGALYSNTVNKWIEGQPTSDLGLSLSALLSKSAMMLQRANKFSREYKPGRPDANFYAYDLLIEDLRGLLPSLKSFKHSTPGKWRTMFLAHSFVFGAMIQLHGTTALGDNPKSREKRMFAAQAVLDLVLAIPPQLDRHLDYLHPVVGTVWTNAFQALIEETQVLRLSGSSTTVLAERLRGALSAIQRFKRACALLEYQISAIEEALAAL
ncbi:Zn(2)-C6 fungal-type domain-containing protein [Mycena chlorophos]|uniref:Zn(2)-C6 fungal-type domain-containing protein n=1 Tax=Mycena chlorophos TaxID=658473 RepID=A0A8H6TQF8_MYCCL|nr:Zn(2)-C6 fungal-type domain-containing protein [Mycena chlorophos]